MTAAVMGRTRSPQADTISELYASEAATGQRRTVLKTGVIRAAFYQRGQNRPVSVWFVFPSGKAVREVTA